MISNLLKYFLTAFVFLFLSSQLIAQDEAEKDLNKIRQFIPNKLDSALILSQRLLTYPITDSDSLTAISHYFQGIINYYQGHYYISSEHYRKALNTDFVAQNLRFKGKIHNNLGVNLDMTDQYDLALKEYFKSLEVDKKFNELAGIAQSHLNIGLLYFNLKQYDNGLKYINQALEYFKDADNHQGMGLCYHNIGLLHLEEKNYNQALDYFFKANSEYIESGDPYERGVNLNNLVICASEMGYIEDAFEFLKESKRLSEQNDFQYLHEINLLAEAELNIRIGNYKKAKNSLKLISPTNNRTLLKKSLLDLQIDISSNAPGNTHENIEEYADLRDSLENYQTNQLILELHNQYGTEIDTLSAQLNEERNKNQKLIYFTILLSGLLIVLIALFIFAKRK